MIWLTGGWLAFGVPGGRAHCVCCDGRSHRMSVRCSACPEPEVHARGVGRRCPVDLRKARIVAARPTVIAIESTAVERAEVKCWTLRRTMPQALATRARLMLAAAVGWSTSGSAPSSVSNMVQTWRQRDWVAASRGGPLETRWCGSQPMSLKPLDEQRTWGSQLG